MPLAQFLAQEDAIASVTLVAVRGSAPREVGAVMYVSAEGCHGTIGGGQLEYMAIDQARVMLGRGEVRGEMDVPLGPQIGQCCGGRVQIELRVMDTDARARAIAAAESALAARPEVLIFGAGHVGRALAAALGLLPVRAVLIDSRAQELALCDAGVETVLTPLPEARLREAAPGCAYVIASHDHGLDFMLAAEALARKDARYVGMIGSTSKRAAFEGWCGREMPLVNPGALVCPIGAGGKGDKRPAVIAAHVAAEILAVRTEASVGSAIFQKINSGP